MIRSVLVLAVLGLLAGCLETPAPPHAVLPRQPIAKQVQFAHPVVFAPGSAALLPDQGQALTTFLNSARVGEKDRLALVARPAAAVSGLPAGQAHRYQALAGNRARTVAAQLAARGLKVAPTPQWLPLAAAPREGVVLVVERIVAVPLGCPDWTRPSAGNYENALTSNYGCAVSGNLARMIANPDDLQVSRPLGPASGEVMGRAVGRYLDGKVGSDGDEAGGAVPILDLGSLMGGE